MKKTLWIAIVGALAASVIAASAQEVLSANAVGYIKKTLPPAGKIISVSIPLNNMSEASNVFGRTSIGQEAPEGTYVYFWNESNQIWQGSVKRASPKFWQPRESNHVVLAGEGFFLKSSVTQAVEREVTITGEVPDDPSLTRYVIGSNNIATLANPFPVDMKFGTSSIASNATVGSYVYFWNTSNQIWQGSAKRASPKFWQPRESNTVVLAAEGFFMKEVSNVTSWVGTKPYTWP